MDSQQSSGEQSEQQELVYPPPPSYYENMQAPAELPPLPGKPVQPELTRPQPVVSMPPGYYDRGVQGQYYSPPPVKRSRGQTWIIVSIIGVSVLLLCGAGSWALYNIFGAVYQQVNGATQVVQDFYQHAQKQDYSGAYADLQISGLTLNTFTQKARAVNAQYGTITSFNINAAAFNSSTSAPNTSSWQVTVSVTRQLASYNVPISINTINGNWIISQINLSKF
ncbi:MAG TPA: hypothetical protein VKR83_16380 [Ktedonobacteraceae bacterium]|nr:hypothetical protein [Ktedonobacteraceae bacterium]